MQARHVISVTSVTVDNDILKISTATDMWHALLAFRAILFENIYILVKADSHIQIVLAEA